MVIVHIVVFNLLGDLTRGLETSSFKFRHDIDKVPRKAAGNHPTREIVQDGKIVRSPVNAQRFNSKHELQHTVDLKRSGKSQSKRCNRCIRWQYPLAFVLVTTLLNATTSEATIQKVIVRIRASYCRHREMIRSLHVLVSNPAPAVE